MAETPEAVAYELMKDLLRADEKTHHPQGMASYPQATRKEIAEAFIEAIRLVKNGQR